MNPLTILLAATPAMTILAHIFVAVVVAAILWGIFKMLPITVKWRNLLNLLLLILLLIYVLFYSGFDLGLR